MDIENIRKGICDFICEWLKFPDAAGELLDNSMIDFAIKTIIKKGVFESVEEMRRELLREKNILAPLGVIGEPWFHNANA